MNVSALTRGSFQWILLLTSGLWFAAAGLRALLIYRSSPALPQVLGLWLLALVLFILSETAVLKRLPGGFFLYVVTQAVVLLLLLFMPGPSDVFAILFAVLGMQIMQRWNARAGALCVGLFVPLITVPLLRTYGIANGAAFALLYTFANVLFASFSLAARRAQQARSENEALTRQLEQANSQLQAYSRQVEQLAAARERHHLARELHDSVTQTIYSMTLSTQSALLLLDHDPTRVGPQLERLDQLAQNAVVEMRALISQLHPVQAVKGGLVAALERHIASQAIPEGLDVSFETEGDEALDSTEEQSLFRIAQEALNNIIKHAHASQACIRLRLAEPFLMEIGDKGCGFDMQRPPNGGVGLSNMRERAAEIGWSLEITSAPGAGTRIRVEKRRA